MLLTPRSVARTHGLFNLLGSLWPILDLRSFEKLFGPKTDDWPESTVGGLMVFAGWGQLSAEDSPEGHRLARRLGLRPRSRLLTIDVIYVPLGHIRATYLIDAAMEIGWIVAWAQTRRGSATRANTGTA